MRLRFITAAAAVALLPTIAGAQGITATKAQAEQVVKIISADKAKTRLYCELSKLGDQVQQADRQMDEKKADELSKKMDEMSGKLGPEYTALMGAFDDFDPGSPGVKDIMMTLESLNKLCTE